MNNLYQQLNPQGASSNSIISMLKNSKNPQALLQTMAKQNPQVRQIMELVNQNGGNPKQAFYNLAKQRGVDPESILSQLR